MPKRANRRGCRQPAPTAIELYTEPLCQAFGSRRSRHEELDAVTRRGRARGDGEGLGVNAGHDLNQR